MDVMYYPQEMKQIERDREALREELESDPDVDSSEADPEFVDVLFVACSVVQSDSV